MTRSQWIILAVLGASVLCVFCAAGVLAVNVLMDVSAQTASALLEPTATPTEPATPTPRPTIPPTATFPPPATMTRVINLPAAPTLRPATPQAARTRMPGVIQDAWDKSAQIKSSRFELSITMKGNLANLPVANANQEVALLTLTGAKNDKDSQIALKGYVAIFLTGDPNKGFELMTVGDNTYLKGPMPLFGATEDKWYVGKRDQLKTSGNLSLDNPTSAFGAQNPDWTGFAKTTTETLDNVRCDVYVGDRATTLRFFQSLSVDASADLSMVDEVDAAETKFWVCADGYLRQFTLALTGHSKDKPSQTGTMQIRARFSDLGSANIKITPPQNAAPLSFAFATPTKAK